MPRPTITVPRFGLFKAMDNLIFVFELVPSTDGPHYPLNVLRAFESEAAARVYMVQLEQEYNAAHPDAEAQALALGDLEATELTREEQRDDAMNGR